MRPHSVCGAAPYCGPAWHPCQARRAAIPNYRQDAAVHASSQSRRPSSMRCGALPWQATAPKASMRGKKWNLS
ncbi:hypothetical protein L518_4828 [Bordetella bronchiseptica MBORD675]|nr:hypothetical protein L492_0108 [Bordetella bronchiseptica 7E71]KDC56567.1 hypothetical protein L510_0106 [Bordetella bronchiseptica MBORD591]KDC95634.1 hypothetical protein L518_4828 [Bordetella bronchiseptica MBORD675]KDD43491.1 hypothetical protein L532_0040 [Bordetella bronchiseptica OSU095]KDD91057.1 hypothetical protein L531_0107 [Bordetella bronchiseptica MO275]KDD99202.1 hypothetical protein L535_0115 [Bordetella bronchiseptica SBL-F6116]